MLVTSNPREPPNWSTPGFTWHRTSRNFEAREFSDGEVEGLKSIEIQSSTLVRYWIWMKKSVHNLKQLTSTARTSAWKVVHLFFGADHHHGYHRSRKRTATGSTMGRASSSWHERSLYHFSNGNWVIKHGDFTKIHPVTTGGHNWCRILLPCANLMENNPVWERKWIDSVWNQRFSYQKGLKWNP